jgi:membrane-bound lytic murein transglycosylase D
MFKICLSSWLHRVFVALSLSVVACSSQPVHKSTAPAGAEPAAKGSATARGRTSYGVEINAHPAEPLPVVHLSSDPIDNREAHDAQAHDIWQSVRDGFSLSELQDSARVLHYESWYQSEPGYLRLVTRRARPYLYFILEEIERRRLPTELALLPIVESAYIPFAYSRSHAAGLWQFIPETGRLYGLKQNWWYDGRRDIFASTMAALDYLEALNELFEGDWFHALAAYNAGPGRVLREIDKNRALGQSIAYEDLDLSAQTRNYIPKLLAVKAMIQNPDRFGIELWPVPDAPYLSAVDIDTPLDLELAAEFAGMDLNAFHLLNPGSSQWATDPSGPHRVLLPVDRVQAFKQRLATLPENEHVAWRRHLIKSGDTLTDIAQRHHTNVSLLQQANGLASSRINSGDDLLIPQLVAGASDYDLLASRVPQTYVVRPGDSLWSIARSHGVSVSELVSWNGATADDVIRAGDELIVRSYRPTRPHNDKRTGVSTIYYSVQRGDSLYGIARRFNVSVDDLRRWNDMGDKSLLRAGQAMILQIGATLAGS